MEAAALWLDLPRSMKDTLDNTAYNDPPKHAGWRSKVQPQPAVMILSTLSFFLSTTSAFRRHSDSFIVPNAERVQSLFVQELDQLQRGRT